MMPIVVTWEPESLVIDGDEGRGFTSQEEAIAFAFKVATNPQVTHVQVHKKVLQIDADTYRRNLKENT